MIEGHQCWGEMGTPGLGLREVVEAQLRFGLCCKEAPWFRSEVLGVCSVIVVMGEV